LLNDCIPGFHCFLGLRHIVRRAGYWTLYIYRLIVLFICRGCCQFFLPVAKKWLRDGRIQCPPKEYLRLTSGLSSRIWPEMSSREQRSVAVIRRGRKYSSCKGSKLNG
jgi:hypothetical protein